MGGDKIVLLDGAGANGGGAATNGLLSMIPGMFANLIGGNKMDPNLVAALMNGRNNQDGFGGANGWWLWIIVLFYKISRKIVNLLIDSKITKLIVGYNKGWKQNVNIGKKNNQKFTQIPFARLVSYLEYKCELVGIEIVIHEESYTSKCDSLAFEKIGKHENYLGKRKKRGLFQSSVGKLINADVNGALNIMRKVVGDSCESIRMIIDRGLLFNPVRITNVFC